MNASFVTSPEPLHPSAYANVLPILPRNATTGMQHDGLLEAGNQRRYAPSTTPDVTSTSNLHAPLRK